MFHIQSFLSARLFIRPQVVDDDIYFISNISGQLSLYKMRIGGSVPQPLLPPSIALQNPHLIDGHSFYVFPKINKILVMIDSNGDEIYQPMIIPINGGFPEPIFMDELKETRAHLGDCDIKKNTCFLSAESLTAAMNYSYIANLENQSIIKIYESEWGSAPITQIKSNKNVILFESYSAGDVILKEWDANSKETVDLFGTSLSARKQGQDYPISGINGAVLTPREDGLIVTSAIFEDTISPGLLKFSRKDKLIPIEVKGLKHKGTGELEGISHLSNSMYALQYNIDGSSWLYLADFKGKSKKLKVIRTLCGEGQFSGGVLESFYFDKKHSRFVFSFSTATSPTQIYLLSGKKKVKVKTQTSEKVLGIDDKLLSPGEDASFVAEDGLRVSARLYFPSSKLGFKKPRPLIYYVHGGPQGQERPDFAWFSMPLIQFLTLNGFAVFVPNVRGSSGYGLSYMKQVDKDWGGKDRLDHVYAMQLLSKDKRIDINKAAVVGRSYGGYMTLMLAGRHPELWKAAVDMFGPYDLLTFLKRIPESWKPYMKLAVGDLKEDREMLVERSPKTYLPQLACPLMVIQGKNDPRVVLKESQDLVDNLRKAGKQIEFIVFDNEGHDVLKMENRIKCYEEITKFFVKNLQP